jgi:hypothetical protein
MTGERGTGSIWTASGDPHISEAVVLAELLEDQPESSWPFIEPTCSSFVAGVM